MSPSKPQSGRSLGLAIMIGGSLIGVLSLLGLLLPDKARLLHFPALVISIFLIGAGIGLFFGISGRPPKT